MKNKAVLQKIFKSISYIILTLFLIFSTYYYNKYENNLFILNTITIQGNDYVSNENIINLLSIKPLVCLLRK